MSQMTSHLVQIINLVSAHYHNYNFSVALYYIKTFTTAIHTIGYCKNIVNITQLLLLLYKVAVQPAERAPCHVSEGDLLRISGGDRLREHINRLRHVNCDLAAFGDVSALHRHISHHSLSTLVISSPLCSPPHTLNPQPAREEAISLLCAEQLGVTLCSQSTLNIDQSAALNELKLNKATFFLV